MKRPEEGIILVQVLGVLAFASAVAFIMLKLESAALDERQAHSDAQAASALARAGEISVLAPFRRDGLIAPNSDHYQEPWAQVAQDDIEIGPGRFSVDVRDAQARYNVNRLAGGSLSDAALFQRIAVAAGLDAGVADRMAEILASDGPLRDVEALRGRILNEREFEALAPFITALPDPGTRINVNTADEALLRAVFANQATASRLLALRSRKGFLTPVDLSDLGVLLPGGLGLTSDHVIVETQVVVGRSRQRLISLIAREVANDTVSANAISRRWNP